MILTDNALARRLEEVESRIAEEYAKTNSKLFPELGATFESIAGGTAVFAGVDSPMTQAVGLGMSGSFNVTEVDRLEDFYRRQNSPVNIELCPHTDDRLRQELAKRGYKMIEQTNMLCRSLTERDWNVTPYNGVRVRRVRPDEFDKLSRVVARSFIPTHGSIAEEELSQLMVDVFMTFIIQPSATAFLAEIDGEIIGGGVVAVIDRVASLFATSVGAKYRGHGAQSALIQARLNFGIENGCDLAMVSAAPGSTSHRNLERQDFRIVYTRAKLNREF